MSVAYVDTSVVAAIALGEPSALALDHRLRGFDRLHSSNLLEAELRAVFSREKLEFSASLITRIDWILPDRPLTPEYSTVLEAGYLKGADLWHVATALYVATDPNQVSFITLDGQQASVAETLGFSTLYGTKLQM